MIDCIVLAAGYATRLYPLTRTVPKPLLPVAGRPIMDHLLEKAFSVPDIGEVIVVTNERFIGDFEQWRSGQPEIERIAIVNDHSTENDNRIGALRDLALGQEYRDSRDRDAEPAIVLAGDNLFDFELTDFAAFFREAGTDCITTHRLEDPDRLRRTGVIEVDDSWRVTSFQEKPTHPRSTWAVPPFYIYTAATLRDRLPQYLAESDETDAPGSWLPWLTERVPVHAFPFRGRRYDIGNLESYREVRRAFGEENPQ